MKSFQQHHRKLSAILNRSFRLQGLSKNRVERVTSLPSTSSFNGYIQNSHHATFRQFHNTPTVSNSCANLSVELAEQDDKGENPAPLKSMLRRKLVLEVSLCLTV